MKKLHYLYNLRSDLEFLFMNVERTFKQLRKEGRSGRKALGDYPLIKHAMKLQRTPDSLKTNVLERSNDIESGTNDTAPEAMHRFLNNKEIKKIRGTKVERLTHSLDINEYDWNAKRSSIYCSREMSSCT